VAVTVAYPGREGAYSAAAADALYGGEEDLVPLPSFRAVADAVAAGTADAGVLPIESSLSGPVAETHDLLYDSPLSITAQTVLPIRHCLLASGPVALAEVREIHSHPAALDQCRRLLAALPGAIAIAAATTADAAKHVAERPGANEAAIASESAARLFGLTVLAENVGDHPEAYTRFVALATSTRIDRNGKPFRTAFSFVTDHRPGALHLAIEPFGRLGIDLVQLVSRPIPETPWRYRFDAVLEGHPLDEVVRDALAETRARTRLLRVFGAYPVE
jgi:prephenate dehydratase